MLSNTILHQTQILHEYLTTQSPNLISTRRKRSFSLHIDIIFLCYFIFINHYAYNIVIHQPPRNYVFFIIKMIFTMYYAIVEETYILRMHNA